MRLLLSFLRPSPGSWPTDVGLLLGRLFAGLGLALGHGLGKVPPSEGFVGVVSELGFPAPSFFAWGAGLAELGGGLLLAAGLLTRPAALSVVVTMAVAAFMQHGADPFSGKEKALCYLALALVAAVAGPGRLSVDALAARHLRAA